jgi:hypothetical protein
VQAEEPCLSPCFVRLRGSGDDVCPHLNRAVMNRCEHIEIVAWFHGHVSGVGSLCYQGSVSARGGAVFSSLASFTGRGLLVPTRVSGGVGAAASSS